MANTDQEHKQPKSVLWHSSNVSDFLKQNMGMIQANALYNNEFLQASEVWKFVNQVIELIDQHVIDLRKKPELKLNQDAIGKLDKIYNGGCYLVKHYSDDEFLISYWNDKSNEQSSDEKIQELAKKFGRTKRAIESRLEKKGLDYQ